MSDLKIHEFRERAERGLAIPDFAEIERQGRALRRRRVAGVVSGLALVLVAGGGIAAMTTERTDGMPPVTPDAPTPAAPPWDDGVRTTIDRGEVMLAPGTSSVVYGGVEVGFRAPSEDWEWWDVGMGLRRAGDDANRYAETVFFLPRATARLQPCAAGRSQPLGTDTDRLVANVAPLLDLAHSTVTQEPRVVTAFGGTAVHLQLEATAGCSEYGTNPAQLRGVINGSQFDSGWPGRRLLDLWHVVVPGPEPQSLLVASWDLGGTSRNDAELQALLDSIEIGAAG